MRISRNLLFRNLINSQLKIIIFTVLLILVSITFIFGKFDNSLTIKSFRSLSTSIIYQISSTIISPIKLVSDGIEKIIDIKNLYQEVEQYKRERMVDAASFQEIISLKLKITKYEDLLNLSEDQEYGFITSRIVADLSQKYFSSILINSGKKDGVFRDMSISGPNGLIGRVSDVDSNISRGLLITDVNSRVPVSISDKSYQGILVGQSHKNPKVEFIKEINNVSIGDLVTTSGKGGVFPPYLFVGQVVNKNKGSIEVQLFENVDQLTHVRLLKFKSIKSSNNDF